MIRFLKIFLLFALCCASSFFLKTCHFNREAVSVAHAIGDAKPLWHDNTLPDMLPTPRPNFMPFLLESSMMYAYSADVAAGKTIPASDPRLIGMEHLPPWAQMSMVLEWVLGYSWRAWTYLTGPPAPPSPNQLRFQDNPAFASFVSVQVRLWTSFISGLVFLWLIVLKTPAKFAFLAGMFHALSAAAVARATGQDIVRGDFCIPLILLAFTLAHSAFAKPSRWKLILLFFTTFVAFPAWDLCQLLFGAWTVFELFRWCAGGRMTPARRKVWITVILAIVLDGLLVPVDIAYGLLMSEFVTITLPLLGIACCAGLLPAPRFAVPGRRIALMVAAGLVLWGFRSAFIENPEYRSTYSHFSECMKAKLKFNNIKPRDPELLNYDARMLWTPAMNSLDWNILVSLFPSVGSLPGMFAAGGPKVFREVWNYGPVSLILFFGLLLLAGLFTRLRISLIRDLPRSLLPFLFTVGFLVGFFYIVRYHEFLIIFLSLSLGLLSQEYSRALRGRGWGLRCLRTGLCILLIGALTVEALASLTGRRRDYGNDTYLGETAALVAWLRKEDVRGKNIIAEFTLGPQLLSYCGARIAMQPQFGLYAIRKPVEDYLNVMFHGTEDDLLAFCEKYRADYLIYDMGSTTSLHPNSARYIANAKIIRTDSPANRMNVAPNELRHFYPIDVPEAFSGLSRKYRVFKVILPADRAESERLFRAAERSFREGRRQEGMSLLKESLVRDPKNDAARMTAFRLFGRFPELSIRNFKK